MATTVQRDRGNPRYLQIAEDLAQQIRAGVLAPGDKMPSESELMVRYAVSQGTARKAVAELRPMGLIDTHHGRGSFVKSQPPTLRKSSDRFRRSHRRAGKAAYLAESEQAGKAPAVTVLYIGPAEAPSAVAERLEVLPGSQVLARRRLYFSNGIPVEEATSYLPWDIAKEIPELFAENPGGGGIYARLEDNGHVLGEFRETVRARLATKQETVALSLSPGSPVFHLTRSAQTRAGRTVEVCDTIMVAEQFVLDYRIPAGD
ncbi:GntR family transcriptional regulator [Streptomyces sp. 150FB]|uniref:GntR family transcriptional regulator n=1 Tax=Streptomyces sp. 150FB TaxID=1576605 RepID=UPI0005893CF9|nr:GntR family transcriptional regulator [Streptomyces sp. 150FB]KIF74536.1 GntR family transcriptional regulator [Streptomyces sp. 150FB]